MVGIGRFSFLFVLLLLDMRYLGPLLLQMLLLLLVVVLL